MYIAVLVAKEIDELIMAKSGLDPDLGAGGSLGSALVSAGAVKSPLVPVETGLLSAMARRAFIADNLAVKINTGGGRI